MSADDYDIVVCTECQSSQGPFSNRQRKRGNAARCTSCIDQADTKKREREDEEDVAKKRRKIETSRNEETKKDDMNDKNEENNDNEEEETPNKPDEESSCSDHNNDTSVSMAAVSIQAMKRKILRRDLSQDAVPEKVQDFSCVICHELLFEPVSLVCGHNFCEQCWIWWEAKHHTVNSIQCPTCRTNVTTTNTIQPNRLLQRAMEMLFPHEMATRKLDLVAGEGTHHDMGHAVIVDIHEDGWKDVDGLQIRRNTVLDDSDQRMVYTLAVRDIAWENDTIVHVTICRLHMEQDEAEEGMPVLIDNADDEWLIVDDTTSKRLGVFDHQGPVQTGRIGHLLSLDMKSASSYSIRHEPTCCELQIRNNPLGSVPRRREPEKRSLIDEGHCSEDDEVDDDENELDSDDERFLVDENSCAICNDGGELLVCDGGDCRGGCAKSFHVKCIGRSEIPDGDWICQDCAAEAGIVTGIEGHEYPVSDDESGDDNLDHVAQFSGSEDELEDEVRPQGGDKKKQRKAILVDSDDEESD